MQISERVFFRFVETGGRALRVFIDLADVLVDTLRRQQAFLQFVLGLVLASRVEVAREVRLLGRRGSSCAGRRRLRRTQRCVSWLVVFGCDGSVWDWACQLCLLLSHTL